MTDGLERCLPVTLVYEGGYSNNPHDPGGATMEGVTQRVYDAYRRSKQVSPQSVRRITKDELEDIYRNQYWNAARCGEMQPGVDMVVFDCDVNSGPVEAIMLLQKCLGVAADGHAGMITMDKLRGVNDIKALIESYCAQRLTFMHHIRSGTLWKYFSRGWSARVRDVQAKAIGMVAR